MTKRLTVLNSACAGSNGAKLTAKPTHRQAEVGRVYTYGWTPHNQEYVMKTVKEYSETAKREVNVDVDALLAAINEISESEVKRIEDDPTRVRVNDRDYHTWRELAEAFELDIHDFSVTEVNR